MRWNLPEVEIENRARISTDNLLEQTLGKDKMKLAMQRVISNKVNHDILLDRISKKVYDQRVLNLIRKYLKSGIMINGIVVSNIMLDEVDKELEKRGHKFCRFADDCNICVKSKKAGLRVLSSIKRIVEKDKAY